MLRPPRALVPLLALACAGCALGRAPSRDPAPARASDFRPAQVRQAAVFLRVGVSQATDLPRRERGELAARYEGVLLEALDTRAVVVRDVHSAGTRGALPAPAAAAARAREVGADHAVIVTVVVEPDVVRVCEDTRRPLQGRTTVWKQDGRIVRASDGAERLHVEVAVPDVQADCEGSRPTARARGSEATTTAAVESLLAKLFGR